MAAFNKFNQFVADKANGVHNLGSDSLKVALCATASAPVATNSVLADLTEISYTNVVTTPTAGRVINITASSQTSGTYKLVGDDMVITATGGPIADFQYVVIYNDTPTSPADPLIGWYDKGSVVSLSEGESITIDLDQVNGIISET